MADAELIFVVYGYHLPLQETKTGQRHLYQGYLASLESFVEAYDPQRKMHLKAGRIEINSLKLYTIYILLYFAIWIIWNLFDKSEKLQLLQRIGN